MWGPLLSLAGLLAVEAGCARTTYASPAAAKSAGEALPLLTYPIFKNRTVAVRVLDNRMDRPQSGLLVDEVRALIDGSLTRAQLGKSSASPAVFEVRIVRYGAESDLSKWRACAGFGATVELAPAVRHEVVSDRCAVTENVWGTESADQILRVAFRQAALDLLSQVDMLQAPAAAQPSGAATPGASPAAGPGDRPADVAAPAVPVGPAEPAPAAP